MRVVELFPFWGPRAPFNSPRARVAALVAGALGCSESATPVGSLPTPTISEEAGSSTPQACGSDAECARAHHCQSNVCVDDCAAGAVPSCLGGCDDKGRCLPSPVLPQGDYVFRASGAEVLDAGIECIDEEVTFEQITPTVSLLIDQSGSMVQPLGTGSEEPASRWSTIVATLGAQDSFVKSLGDEVRFGLTLYTSHGGYGSGELPLRCPELEEVGIGFDNFEPIRDRLLQHEPERDTPTAESIAAVAQALSAYEEEGPKYIILATDGEPDTCEDPNPHDSASRQEAARSLSVAAVASAYEQGIGTYVVSLASGSQLSPAHLKDLAVAGAGGDPGAEAFTALDTAALEAAFNTIITGVRSCDFRLNGSVESRDAARGTVVLDGRSLDFGDPDGWTMSDESTVRLYGAACDAILDSASQLTIAFPCGTVALIE